MMNNGDGQRRRHKHTPNNTIFIKLTGCANESSECDKKKDRKKKHNYDVACDEHKTANDGSVTKKGK